MKKSLLNLEGAQKLTSKEQKGIIGGGRPSRRCGGDGSFIMVDGEKVCCYDPWSGLYQC
ncbi:hypothetical protein N7U66_01660 [Lacinutrix neustonica]|uniref:Uncharacterized protein n=1 Tax=Lacinutrix neustonica TaxID=2980107 RepID=A0A9E8SDH6_9FLAO|nr:hypothetical protein [Lacinutrix neustonica]WAC02448.1 hypothetical protein N7U66_01660 [Lacinutrix neustonica]